jgi:hypothetical protein
MNYNVTHSFITPFATGDQSLRRVSCVCLYCTIIVDRKCQAIRAQADQLAREMSNELEKKITSLPPHVRNMTMGELARKYNGNIAAAIAGSSGEAKALKGN